jgi:ABC-type transport system involved in cytochrome c biogenesis permease component
MSAAATFALHTLRLNMRQPMAMIYGFIFPLIFLAAFAIIYRHDPRPVGAHLGELLTVTALGGACFGLPTALVSERDRGIWTRYRLAATSASVLMAGVITARLVLLFAAGLMQIALATAFGMEPPAAPLSLTISFLVTCLSLICIGLVVAALVNSVLAVQALGQCIFLPMLMLGGIAIRPEALPQWLQEFAAFLPGIHAVTALQAAHDGASLHAISWHLALLVGFAIAAAMLAISLFRWDNRPRRPRTVLLVAGCGIWIATGLAATSSSRTADTVPASASASPADFLRSGMYEPGTKARASAARADGANESEDAPEAVRAALKLPAKWQDVTDKDIDRIAFERLPSDEGLISPLAVRGTLDDPATDAVLQGIRASLPSWAPARSADIEQRVRNVLYIAAVPDVLQMDPLERHLPWLVFDHLRQTTAPHDLRRILFWISQHPADGDSDAARQLFDLGLPSLAGSDAKVRERTMIYALKLLRILEAGRS